MSLSNSQSDFSPKKFQKQNSQSSKHSLNKKKLKENPLKEIRKLYPKFQDDYGYEENNATINKGTLSVEGAIFKKKKKSIVYEEEENNSILSEEFLQNLMKRPSPLNKIQIISVMSKFIQNSSLIQKIQKEFQSDKKLDINELSVMCVEILNYIELKKGKILFRIGDIGDRFYFILSGKICVLKLKEINDIKMDYYEYIDYLMFLINKKETYIFNEVIQKNEKILRINREAEVRSIFKILMLRKLKQSVIEQEVPNIQSLTSYLKKAGCTLEDFDIQLEELEIIENNKLLKNKEREWNNYLFKKCKPSFNDLVLFEPYESLLSNSEKHSITCFCYEPILFLGAGLFFGDFALDSEVNKRNATIRAEEDTILGYLKSVDYINIFAPKRKLEKMKEMSFLYNNYFFGNINSRVFEKNYFHLFYPREYNRNNILFIFGSKPKSLLLLKEGKVSLELKSSIIDLHNLIKYLWDNIRISKWYKALNSYQKKELIPTHVENKIKEYINEPILVTLKVYGDKFIEEVNKIKTYQISMLTSNEIIGLEEIYLNMPYIMKGTVVDNKLFCYEISVEHINKFLTEEKQILFPFIKSAVNKIISLIERLQNFKKNGINMAKNKFEKDYLDFIKIHENENKSKFDDNNIKINEINVDKERSVLKAMKKNNINVEQSKTMVKNFNSRNKFKNRNNEPIENKNNLENKRYKSPVRLISTNLMPVLEVIMSKQEKVNKKDFPTIDNNSNIIKQLSQKGLFNEYSYNTLNKNDLELINNLNNIDSTDNINKDYIYDKNNISNSTSTDAMPSSENILKINENKTINVLKKELEKINDIEFDNNEILNLNKNLNNKRSFSYNHLFMNNNIEKNIKSIKKHPILKHQLRLGNFHLSYVPLNVLSPKGRLLQRSLSSINVNSNNINSNISSPKPRPKIFSYLNLYSKKNKTDDDKKKENEKEENINDIWHGIITKGIKNIKSVNVNDELVKYIKNKEIKQHKNELQNIQKYNLLNNNELKKKLSSNVVKNFYKEIKQRGYSSFIPNKDKNTIFNRKYRKKYGSSSPQKIDTSKLVDNPGKNSCILPLINDKCSFILSNKGF